MTDTSGHSELTEGDNLNSPRDPLSHVPERCKAGLAAAHADKPLAKYEGNAEPILEQLRAGVRVADVAKAHGISAVAVHAWLIRHAPDKFLEISAGRSLARIEQAEEDLDGAEDQLAVSRARESARLAQWTLERANRKLYGDNKTDQSGVNIQVVIARGVDEPQSVTIEAER